MYKETVLAFSAQRMSIHEGDALHETENSVAITSVNKERTFTSESNKDIGMSHEGSYQQQVDGERSAVVMEKFGPDSHKQQIYICGGCNASFDRLRSLRRHRCYDAADSPAVSDKADTIQGPKDRYNAKIDSSSDVMMESSKSSRPKEKPFQCTACPKKYAKHHYLTKHFALTHSGIMPWKCPNCGTEFSSSVKFKEHCKHHGISKPFKCDKCTSSFASHEVLRVHDRTHTGDRPFLCEVCGKKFKQCSNLQDHIRKHKNERSFICGTCGKSFNLKGDLTKHLLLHTGERKHQCHYCPKAFPGVSNFNRHMRTHTGVKPFTCSHCQKSFPRRERLKEHERIHTGEKPFKCHICGKSFSDSGNFSNHKRGHEDASLQKWKRFPKRVTTSLSTKSSSEKLNMGDATSTEVSTGPDSSCSISPSQPLKIVLALQSQLVYCAYAQVAGSLLYVTSKEVNGKLDMNQIDVQHASPMQPQLQVVCEKQDEQFPVHLDSQKEPDSLSQPSIDRTHEAPLCSAANSVSDGSIVSSAKNCESVTNLTDDNLSSFDLVRTAEVLPFSDSFSLPENCQNVVLTPTKFLPSAAFRPLFEDGLQRVESAETEEGDKLVRVLEDTNSTVGGEKDVCGSLGPMSSSLSGIMGDVPEKYCSSNLTLMDLTKAVEIQGFSGQSDYLIMQDGKNEQRKLGGILLATPTKSYPEEKSQSPGYSICSQILVTPEHASLPSDVTDREKVKRRVLDL